jgi:hypothetical protein
MVTYPIALQGENVIHADDAIGGVMYQCPECSKELFLRVRGDNRHFVHNSDSEGGCRKETFVHYMSKHIIERFKYVLLPEVILGYPPYTEEQDEFRREFNLNREGAALAGGWLAGDRTRAELDIARKFPVSAVTMEKLFDDVKPDLVLWSGKVRLFLEIKVSHEIGHVKRKKLKAKGLNVLELDLSHIDRDLTYEELQATLEIYLQHSEMKINRGRYYWVCHRDMDYWVDAFKASSVLLRATKRDDGNYAVFCSCTDEATQHRCIGCEYCYAVSSDVDFCVLCMAHSQAACAADFVSPIPEVESDSKSKRKKKETGA